LYLPETSKYFVKGVEKEFNLNLKNSYVLGDHPGDIEMGHNAGVKSVYLLTGHGQKHLKELIVKPNLIAKNIYEAALLIDKGGG
jgi:D-glycero-D-manno-heptose 1,7-bisphosphate phosphatase